MILEQPEYDLREELRKAHEEIVRLRNEVCLLRGEVVALAKAREKFERECE